MAGKADDIESNTLFIRNLPFSATNKTLEDVFSDIGPLKQCFVVKDKDKDTCRGIGYVQFTDRNDAVSAKKSVRIVDGRNVFIAFADHKHKKRKGKKGKPKDEAEKKEEDKEGKEEKEEKKPKPQIGKTVVLSGLAKTTELEHIQKLIEDIKNTTGVQFPVPGRDTSTAFVTFKSQKDAKKGITKLNGMKLKGASLNAILQSLDAKSVPQKILKRSRLIIRNLSFKCDVDCLKKEFSKFGEITDAQIPKKSDGKKLGFGFVQYVRPNQASAALEAMNAKPILGRPVAVDWAIAKDEYARSAATATPAQSTKSKNDADSSDDDDDEEEDEEKVKGGSDSSEDEEEEEEEVDEEQNGEDESEDEEEERIQSMDQSKEEESESEEDEKDSEEDDDDSDDEEDDDDEDDDDSDDSEEETEKNKKPAHTKGSADVDQGKTVFVRNLSYDTIEDDLKELMSEIGDVAYVKMVIDRNTDHSKGIAFVKFKSKEDAEKCVKTSEDSSDDGGIYLDGRQLNVTLAVSRDKAEELKKAKKEKEPKDNRNLWLAREGMIRPGTQAATGLSKVDLDKRMKVDQMKRSKLKNPQVFISTTRLCVRNVPVRVEEKELKKIYLKAADDTAASITECRIMRDMTQVNSEGVAKSRGFAFINFAEHKHALKALRHTNNNPELFGEKKRLIVEFSLENKAALHAKEKRLERHQMRVGALKNTGGAPVRPKKQKKATDKSVLESDARPATKEKRKAASALPSHWGPKIRHKPRQPEQGAAKGKKKNLQRQQPAGKRAADSAGLNEPPKKKKKNRGRKEVRDDFDRLVGKYRQKFAGSINKSGSGMKTSKWFE